MFIEIRYKLGVQGEQSESFLFLCCSADSPGCAFRFISESQKRHEAVSKRRMHAKALQPDSLYPFNLEST